MIKINIICVSKNKDRWIDESITHYQKLLRKFAQIAFTIIPDIKNSKSISEKELMKKEAKRIVPHLKSSYKIALSDSGKKYDSLKFADHLQSIMNSYGGSLDIIIGGIYGLDKTILSQCNETLSLSPMTFSHQLVRPVLLEQLYRAFSILSGGKYHK